MAVSLMAMPAGAVYGSAGGANTSGSTTMGAASATGTTTCSQSASMYVETTFTYGYGDDIKSCSDHNSNFSSSVMVTAYAREPLMENIVAKYANSYHAVFIGTETWSDYSNA